LHYAYVKVDAHVRSAECQFELRDDIDHEVFAEVANASRRIDFKENAEHLSENECRNHGARKLDVTFFAVILCCSVEETGAEFVVVGEAFCNELLCSDGEHDRACADVAQVQVAIECEEGTWSIAVANAKVKGCPCFVQLVVCVDIELCADIKLLVESSCKVDGEEDVRIERGADADTETDLWGWTAFGAKGVPHVPHVVECKSVGR